MKINNALALDPDALSCEFIRSSGPGGQNVNKVATAVQLRYDTQRDGGLPDAVRHRLLSLAGNQATKDGVIVITARRYRTQGQNRVDAEARLRKLIQRAMATPKPRKKTRPSARAKQQRLEQKRNLGQRKRLRKPPVIND